MRERRRREWRSDIFGRKVRPRNGMQTPRQHIGAILTPAARSPASRSPSGDEQRYGRNGVALLGIVVQATTCVARLMIIPIFRSNALGEELFSASLMIRPRVCLAMR